MTDLENPGLRSKAEGAARRKDPPKKKSSSGGAPDLSSLGSDSSSSGPIDSSSELATPSTFKRGGKVRRGGRAKVHKGERVLTAKQNRKYMRGKR